ncbi:MAG: hypothetical protein KDD55_09785, partial [Bdellovibrionales bacterium]|nr:hypothetical protein [Bdellovibrionales bacterium]
PIVFGIKRNNRTFTVNQAISRGICSKSNVSALTVTRRRLRGARFKLGRRNNTNAYAYLSRASGSDSLRVKVRQAAERATSVTVNSDCSPTGNATNLGIQIGSQSEGIVLRAGSIGDVDADGMPDSLDSDVDGDSVINNYDGDFEAGNLPGTFYVFSNLKTGIENTLNSNVGDEPTQDDIDTLLQSTSKLAMEIKGNGDNGDVSELFCGNLTYCSAGGTGTLGEEATAFPGTPGGENDTDSDGLGEMSPQPPANDFQLKPGATSDELQAGDSFVQIVSGGGGETLKFFQKLNFVFLGTPAITQITIHPGKSDESTTQFSYPLANGAAGTNGNCILFEPSADDASLTFEITAYRPQRPGLEDLGEASFVDIGGSDVSIDIPNEPCSSNPCSVTRTPNVCPVSTYTESDDNLSIVGERMLDGASDSDADPAHTLRFTADIKSCLAGTSDTFDAGEQLDLGLQFRSVSDMAGSDNAAINLCFRRNP